MKDQAPKTNLRPLSLLAAWAMSFGCAIGWGAFVVPGTTFLPAAGPVGSVIGLAIGTASMAVIAWNYRYMMSRAPGPGGSFAYARLAFGGDNGFLAAWFVVLTYLAILWANATALVLVARHVAGDALAFGFSYSVLGYKVYFGEAAFCSAAILLGCAICLVPGRLALRALIACALTAVGGVAAIFLYAVLFRGASLAPLSPPFAAEGPVIPQVLRIVALAPWAYVGFEAISHSSHRFSFPARKSFGVMLAALAAGGAVYTMLTLVPAMLLPDGCASWTDVVAQAGVRPGLLSIAAAEKVLGVTGRRLMTASMLAAIGTTLIANLIVVARALRAMAGEGMLPAFFARLSPGGRPLTALVFTALVSAAIPFGGRTIIGSIVDVASIGTASAYAYTSAATFKLARAEGDRASTATGAVGTVLSGLFLVMFFIPNFMAGATLAPESYLVISIWCILGFLHFRHIFINDRENRYGRTTIVWSAMLALIFFASMIWQYETERKTIGSALEEISRNHPRIYASGMTPEEMHGRLMTELQAVARATSNINIVQSGLLILAVAIMLNLYGILRRREAEMEGLKVKAEEMNKTKNAFLASVSHDMRTPLNAILGFATLARMPGNQTPGKIGEYADKISAAGEHLLSYVDDIIELRRIETGKLKPEFAPCDIAGIAGFIRDLFAVQAERKRLRLSVESRAIRNATVLCDEALLRRLTANLVSNAIKYTPAGGHVSATLEQVPSAEPGKAAFVLTVADDGIGMSQEFAAHVFEAFERERGTALSGVEGFGLGMAIVKHIVDLLGGEISLKTEQGKGSSFTVRLAFEPAAQALQAAPEAALEAAPKAEAGAAGTPAAAPRHVLLADDNEINREVAVSLLEANGVKADAVTDGRQAVDAVLAAPPGTFDAVLMDIRMPVLDGLQASREIRALPDAARAAIPIVALTANADAASAAAAAEAGVDALATKPIRIGSLFAAIAEAMEKGRKRT